MVGQARWTPHVCLKVCCRLERGQRADLPSSLCCSISFSSVLFPHFFPLSFSPHNKVKYPSAADYRKQQLSEDFSILLSSFTFVLSCRFDSRFGGMFEAISEMTCCAHIFKHFPFVMQMDATPSIRRKADTC